MFKNDQTCFKKRLNISRSSQARFCFAIFNGAFWKTPDVAERFQLPSFFDHRKRRLLALKSTNILRLSAYISLSKAFPGSFFPFLWTCWPAVQPECHEPQWPQCFVHTIVVMVFMFPQDVVIGRCHCRGFFRISVRRCLRDYALVGQNAQSQTSW